MADRVHLQLLRPEFSNLMSKEQENEVFELIGRLIQMLSSPEITIDDRHTPKLYARFLAGFLMRHRRDGGSSGRMNARPPPHNPLQSRPNLEFQLHPQSGGTSTTFSVSQGQSSGGQQQQHQHRHALDVSQKPAIRLLESNGFVSDVNW